MSEDGRKDLTILVTIPDSYNDIFKVFVFMLWKHWPDCPYQIVLANETMQPDYPGVRVINCGKGKTSVGRELFAMEQITSKFVLLTDADVLISRHVNTVDFEKIISVMQEYSINYFRLYDNPKIRRHSFMKYKYLHYIPQRLPYGLNSMSNIWNREYYMQYIQKTLASSKEGITGWDVEVNWLKATLDAPNKNFEGYVSDSRDLFKIIHGVSKGKWFPSAIKKIKQKGYQVDLSTRGTLSRSTENYLVFKRIVGSLLPSRMRRAVKKILSNIGFKFTSDY